MRSAVDRIGRGVGMRRSPAYIPRLAIVFLGALLVCLLQYRTPREEGYRQLADRDDRMVGRLRSEAREARARRDFRRSEEFRIRADRLESQARLYRRASHHRWAWPTWRWPPDWWPWDRRSG